MVSMIANDSGSCVARDWKAHSNVLRYLFHWRVRCLGGKVQLACCRRKKSWPRALTRHSVVPHHLGLTAWQHPRPKRPGLRAMEGSQAQRGWRPSWAEHRDHSETLARLTSPGSKQNDDLPEGLEPRTNSRKHKRMLRRMLPKEANTDLNSSLPPNQPMERTPPCCALRRRSSARYMSAG